VESIAKLGLESIHFSASTFLFWGVTGGILFWLLYALARRIGVPQHFSVYVLVIPGALLCAVASGVFGASCGLIPPVLYAGMILGGYLLRD